MTIDRVDSTSDERTVNNLMRHQYRVLSDEEKQHMQEIKDAGLAFVALLHRVSHTENLFDAAGEDARLPTRELALAQTKIEEAVMWSIKHLTKG